MKNYSKKKIFSYAAAILLACVLVAAAVCGHVLSRYTDSDGYVYNQVSVDDFYFTVNILGDTVDDESSTKTINLYGGAQSISFSVWNYFDSLRVTETDITYTVSYESSLSSGSALSSFTKGSGSNTESVTSGASQSFTYSSASANHQQTTVYTLTVGAFTTVDETITVTIQSTEPFLKTLTLKFVLNAADSNVGAKVVNNSAISYAELIITTDIALTAGNVTLVWTSATDLLFDNTNSYFDLSLIYTNTATSSKAIPAEASISVKFFKDNYPSAEYTASVVNSGDEYTITITQSASG